MLKVFWGYFRAVILAVIVGLAAVTATEIEKIPDASMEPLIEHDDFVFINKAVYVYKEPEAGDVVALRSRLHTSSGGGAVIASRVAGAAGDVIELPGGEKETVKEGFVYLISAEDEAEEALSASGDAEEALSTTGGNLYAVEGDSADSENSSMAEGSSPAGSGRLDSRNSAVGQVPLEDILGRVECVLWPFEHIGRID